MRLVLALACGCGVAFAALQYRDFADQTVGDAGYSLDVDGDGIADFDFSFQSGLYPLGVVFTGAQDNIVTLSTAQWDVMKPLAQGDSVKVSEFYGYGDAYLSPNYASGTFPTNVDRYLGFRFTKNNQGFLGWLRVNYSGTAVTLKDLVWNNTANQSLRAGQMPSSSAVSSSGAFSSSKMLSSSVAVSSSVKVSSSSAGGASSAQVVLVRAGALPSLRGSQLYLPAGTWTLRLWDFSGRVIWEKADRAQQARWLLLDVNPGGYVLDLQGAGQKLQFKMVR